MVVAVKIEHQKLPVLVEQTVEQRPHLGIEAIVQLARSLDLAFGKSILPDLQAPGICRIGADAARAVAVHVAFEA